MAKEAPVMTVTVDDSSGSGQDISNDITSVTISTPSEQFDVTGLDKSAMEKLLGRADASVTLNGVFNDAVNKSHAVLKDYRTLSGSEVGRTVALTVSGQTLTMELLFENYELSHSGGQLTWTATGHLADGTVPAWS